MTDKAYAVPLHEQLARVPREARLVIEDADGMGTSFIPVGRMCHEAAAELRRLHEEVQQWQEKCNTYIEIHDAVVKDNERLHEVNAELVEALRDAVGALEYRWETVANRKAPVHENAIQDAYIKAKAALAKAQGDNNG